MDINSLNVKGLCQAGVFQIVSEQTLGSAQTSVTISGLSGDADVEYILLFRGVLNGANQPYVQFNGDTGTNYGEQYLAGNNTSTVASQNARDRIYCNANLNESSGSKDMTVLHIYAKSGAVRSGILYSVGDVASTTCTNIYASGFSWNNSGSNITSMLIGGVSSGFNTGTYICLLKKVVSPGTSQGFNSVNVPTAKMTANVLETIYENTLSGAATSVTISGLDGDTDIFYELETRQIQNGAGTAELYLYLNNDSTLSNYGIQYLRGNVTTPSAGRYTTGQAVRPNYSTATTRTSSGKIWLYAKSGFLRTGILEGVWDVTGTTATYAELEGFCWNNTGSNLTSIVLTNAVSSGMGVGTYIRLKALKHST